MSGENRSNTGLEDVNDRLAKLESAVIDLTSTAEEIRDTTPHAERVAQYTNRFVTKEEMAGALERTEMRIEDSIAEQFGKQSLAIGSLRAMIADTDALLERVLERLESSVPEEGDLNAADPDAAEPDAGDNAPEPGESGIRQSDEETILSLKDAVVLKDAVALGNAVRTSAG